MEHTYVTYNSWLYLCESVSPLLSHLVHHEERELWSYPSTLKSTNVLLVGLHSCLAFPRLQTHCSWYFLAIETCIQPSIQSSSIFKHFSLHSKYHMSASACFILMLPLFLSLSPSLQIHIWPEQPLLELPLLNHHPFVLFPVVSSPTSNSWIPKMEQPMSTYELRIAHLWWNWVALSWHYQIHDVMGKNDILYTSPCLLMPSLQHRVPDSFNLSSKDLVPAGGKPTRFLTEEQ